MLCAKFGLNWPNGFNEEVEAGGQTDGHWTKGDKKA